MMRNWYFLFLLKIATALSVVLLSFSVLPTASLQAPTPMDTTPPITVYARAGNPKHSSLRPQGPGLLLMGGGTEVDASFRWMRSVVTGSSHARGGDVVVLRASGANDYDDYMLKIAGFDSAQTIKLGPTATAADLAKAASYVDRAQALFFAGGDQANYVRWKGSSLIAAVQRLYDRGGVVGGTSAGLAILGEWVYDSVAADAVSDQTEVTTKNAVANPAESIISFTHDLLIFPPLRNVILDQHFHQRDRFGRLTAFLAILNQRHPARTIKGLGIDAASALTVDKHGIATLQLQKKGGLALFVSGGTAEPIQPGKPLVYRDLHMIILNRDGQTFDLNTWCAEAPHYTVTVNGNKTTIYDPADPYQTPADARIPHCKA